MKAKKINFFLANSRGKICILLMRDARMLARTRSMLGPKIRAHAGARSCSGFQCSYSLSARCFDARPIPRTFIPHKNTVKTLQSLKNIKTKDNSFINRAV